jgi:type IX secretion system PorP/SprF family membrane protein
LNTALVGNDSAARLGLNTRYQWPNLSDSYTTSSINFYQFIPKMNAYAGINYINDNQSHGTLISNNFSIFYSQNINIKKVLFRPSIEFGFGNKKLDATKLNFGDMIDPRRGFVWNTNNLNINPSISYIDLNLGGMFYYKGILAGFSAHHINMPNVGLTGVSELPIRYGAQLGYTINLKRTTLSPYLFYNQQQNFKLMMAGVNALFFNHLNVTLAYGTNDAVVAGLGYQHKFFKAGSHEFGLAFKFWKVKTKKRFMGVNTIFS